jgi:hypothetical protein
VPDYRSTLPPQSTPPARPGGTPGTPGGGFRILGVEEVR